MRELSILECIACIHGRPYEEGREHKPPIDLTLGLEVSEAKVLDGSTTRPAIYSDYNGGWYCIAKGFDSIKPSALITLAPLKLYPYYRWQVVQVKEAEVAEKPPYSIPPAMSAAIASMDADIRRRRRAAGTWASTWTTF